MRLQVDGSSDGGRTWERTPYFAVPDTHILKGKLPSTDGAEGATGVQVGLIQPSIWASSPTAVHVLCRSNGGAIYRADSVDGGLTWSAARRTAMPNNNSGIDVARLASGRLVMAHNPTGKNWGARTPLRLSRAQPPQPFSPQRDTFVARPGSSHQLCRIVDGLGLAVSDDNGESFPVGIDIEDTPDSEFSYPCGHNPPSATPKPED